MAPRVQNDADDTAEVDYGRLAAEPELVEALLRVYQQLELEDQLRVLIERGARWSGAEAGFALMPADDRRTLSPVASTVGSGDRRLAALGRVEVEGFRRALDAGAVLRDGLGVLAATAEPWPVAAPGATAALAVSGPRGQFAGAVVLLHAEPPDGGAIERLERLVEAARPAVGHALHLRSMRELVIKDDTAHCFNRRYFEACLPEELARASRFGTPLALIFLDMDNLKEVNKLHGHAMGSRTLCEVSRRIRAKIRRFDKLFRYGGDEFCIVLPETEWRGAREVAERVRDAIARQPFLVRELGDASGVQMTASLGIAAFPAHARSQKELIEMADRAMQRIKNGTKNSIGIAETVGEGHDDD